MDDSLREWCTDRLGSHIVATLTQTGNLSRVFTVVLGDGRTVVVKTRPWQDRLVACSTLQSFIAEQGFPCPVPLVPVERVLGQAVSVEENRPGGEELTLDGRAAERFAGLLARLIAIPAAESDLAKLRPSPPWVGWDHTQPTLWPPRDTPGPALDTECGPAWVDAVGAAARSFLTQVRLPPRLGHGDWESQNLRWINGRPHAVHDWDSLIAQPEPAIVGAAAAVWPAGHNGRHAATVQESHAFTTAARQRGAPPGVRSDARRRLPARPPRWWRGRRARRLVRPAPRGGAGADPGVPETLLLRPDGYVAWAGDHADPPGLRAAPAHWCGPIPTAQP